MNTDSPPTIATSSCALREVMTEDVVSVAPNSLIEHALDDMLKHEISGRPVIEDGHLVGVISEFDALNLLLATDGDPHLIIPVAHYMSTDVVSVPEETPLETLAQVFCNLGVRRLPVVRGDRVVGIVSRRDLIRVIRERRREENFETLAQDDWRSWVNTTETQA